MYSIDDFVDDCQRTKSDKFYGNKVKLKHFLSLSQAIIADLNELDQMKKTLFYGKEMNRDFIGQALVHSPLFEGPLAKFHVDILHGTMGMLTEAGEALEVIVKALEQDAQTLDMVNFREEVGDIGWYQGIIAKAMGVSLMAIFKKTIEKLAKRFPEKFTEHAAANRDLDAERKILEGTNE